MHKIIKRHTITITMEINQIDSDMPPQDWHWPGVIDMATDLFRERKAKVIEVYNQADPMPLMD